MQQLLQLEDFVVQLAIGLVKAILELTDGHLVLERLGIERR